MRKSTVSSKATGCRQSGSGLGGLTAIVIGILALAVGAAAIVVGGTTDSRGLYLNPWLEEEWPAELRAMDGSRPPDAVCAVIDLRPTVDRSRELDFARQFGPLLLHVRCGLRLFGVDLLYQDVEYLRVDRVGAGWREPEPTCVLGLDSQGRVEYSLVKYERRDVFEARRVSDASPAERNAQLALDLSRELERVRRDRQ